MLRFLLAFVCLLSVRVAHAEERRPRLFVVESRGDASFAAEKLRLYDDVIQDSYAKVGAYDVISKDEVAALIDQAMRAQLAGADCATSDACLVELGGALGAPYLATTSIGRLGEQVSLTLKLIDVRAARTTARWNSQVPVNDEAIVSAIRRGIAEMHPKLPMAATVTAGVGGLAAVAGVVGGLTALGGLKRMQDSQGGEWTSAFAETQLGGNLATIGFSLAGTAVVTAVVLAVLGI